MILKGLVMILTFVVVGYVLRAAQIDQTLDQAWIDAQVQGRGLHGIALFLLISALVSGVGLPRQIVCVLGGYAFGVVLGTWWALVGQMLGCLLSFYYARLMGRELVRAKFAERVKKLDAFMRDNAFSMTLLVRLSPVGSNLATNLAAGVTEVKALPFLMGTLLGYLPQTIIFALVGDGMSDAKDYLFVVSAILFVLSALLGVYLYRRYRHGKSLDQELEEDTP